MAFAPFLTAVDGLPFGKGVDGFRASKLHDGKPLVAHAELMECRIGFRNLPRFRKRLTENGFVIVVHGAGE
jgi:hypothetical protein